uniref:Uncharacterized protein n=1 Tax=Setaria viridis TaxID=4556 RepID=A0A4U6U8C6_SETVI|nr:hypothetical protein SEVIR_6G119500v2 [Setaria viridis]
METPLSAPRNCPLSDPKCHPCLTKALRAATKQVPAASSPAHRLAVVNLYPTVDAPLPAILFINQPPKWNSELNVADSMYELHPAPEEADIADRHQAGVELVPEQAEDQLANPEFEGKPRGMLSYL